jgi:hypothetical protein
MKHTTHDISLVTRPAEMIRGEFTFVIYDKNGSVRKAWKQPMRSFNRNFMASLQEGLTDNVASGQAVDIVGNVPSSPEFAFNAQAGTSGGGVRRNLRLGTNGDPFDFNVLNLTYIDNGSSAGQLSHSAATVTTNRSTGEYSSLRTFTNNSAGSITVREIGFVCGGLSTTTQFNIIRDVLSPEVVLAPTESLAANLTLTLSRNTNGWSAVFAQIAGVSITVTKISGATVSFGATTASRAITRIVPETEAKEIVNIFLGTGTTVFANMESAWTTRIEPGTGAGQLVYQAASSLARVSAGGEHYFDLTSQALNLSGGDIIATEAAIVGGQSFLLGTGFTNKVLVDRIVFPEPITINAGLVQNIRWRLKVVD